MSHSSADCPLPAAGRERDRSALSSRAQASPVPALVALLAVIAGVAVYAGVVADVAAVAGDDRTGSDRTAETTLDTLRSAASDGDVVDPERLQDAATDGDVMPTGFESNVTLAVAGDVGWTVGPAPPDRPVHRADRTVAVRIGPGEIRRGTLRVRVWQ
ncbi:hypothetical protein RH858_09645 [Halalkaliarchaeum sp. AArc-GB]|uniref:DUF7285 family protein n=1 Tax=Halalkaliarchaeum sp. AArc-GB TaxID=3074078 RepID=UPI00285C8DB7|nr:hypothetical protein [Halalkaliarchaeum sp. AArc-GB]MDR5673408.1 hypothetical protein [Halalkaliarchaeum sp. AArc-GB]